MPTLEEEMVEVKDELKKLSDRLEATLAEGDNPVSQKCSNILDNTPRCYDFSGSRRFAACRAWALIEEKKISWQQAITEAWLELKSRCTWS